MAGRLHLARAGDWEAALALYIAAWRERPFAWGEADCALFAAGAVEVMTGTDPAAAFRGKYSTMSGSIRALKAIGEGTLEAQLDALFAPVASAFAQRGDLVWNSDGSVGVAIGPFALFVGREGEAHGLVQIPRGEWLRAWRIGGEPDG